MRRYSSSAWSRCVSVSSTCASASNASSGAASSSPINPRRILSRDRNLCETERNRFAQIAVRSRRHHRREDRVRFGESRETRERNAGVIPRVTGKRCRTEIESVEERKSGGEILRGYCLNALREPGKGGRPGAPLACCDSGSVLHE